MLFDVEAALAKLRAAREVASQIRPVDLAESDALYAEVEKVAEECESLTWSVTMLGRPRTP